MIELQGITKSFGTLQVLKGIDLMIEKGEVVIRCSPLFPQSEIEKLIRNHQEEILEQIKGYVPKYNYLSLIHI